MADINRGELAKSYFMEGYNCSQSVAMAFSDLIGMDKDQVAKLVSGFGAGLSRMREVCGTVSGFTFVISALYGNSDPKDAKAKQEIYTRVQTLANKFTQENGSIICRELLGLNKKGPDSPTPEPRTQAYYKKRPCPELVAYSATILDEYIKSQE